MKAILKSIHFLLFVALASAICHLLYSWIGFNPTDEGFVLAGARRILDGQFPHVDFLSLRPLGSSYLHTFELLYGGDQVFYFSRLIFWIQSSIIAWIWVALANKLIKLEIILIYKYMLSAIVLIFNVHSFPAMAWTTIDGLFLASIGLFFITHFSKNGNQFGYVLLGCAALCKQNFLVLIPAVFIFMMHFKRPYYLLDALTPILVYLFFIWKFDALPDLQQQLFSRSELWETGFITYLTSPPFYLGIIIPILINLFRKKYKGFLQHIDFILVFDLIILGAISLVFNVYVNSFSFALFGFLVGYTFVHIKRKGVVVFNLLSLTLAWTASISLGYNSPALGSGLILAALLAINYDRSSFGMKRPLKFAIASTVLIGLFLSFNYTRKNHTYKENIAKELTADLGKALKGGNNIITNPLTQKAFDELDSLAITYEDSLVIVPDYAAFWATSKYPNPLNLDWPNKGEMDAEFIRNEVSQHLDSLQGEVIIAKQKYRASELHLDKNELEDEDLKFPIVDMVKALYSPFSETEFFILYR